MKKKIIFPTIALSLPFVILFLIELTLRLFNIQNSEKVFIEDLNNSSYYIVNPKLGQRLLANASIKPALTFINKVKNQNEIRIIALGASTTVGFPFGHEVAFPKILENKLQCQYPNKQIKVINIGLTAINTYSILDIIDEAINIDPDFVVFYAGQNEFYGKYGIASTQSGGLPPSLIRMSIRLNKLRITRLIKSLLKSKGPKVDKNQTLMAKMVGNKEINYNSKSYTNGIKQFSHNLNEILEKFNQVKVPVFIGTLVSNQRGLSPFNSVTLTPQLNANLSSADELFNSGQIKRAFNAYRNLLTSKPNHASLNFKVANCYYEMANYDSAKHYYGLASKYDLLRFRAPQEYNDIINSKKELDNVTIVSVKENFEKNSAHNIIDNDLLLEHVHPTIKGYELMAESFYTSVINSEIIDQTSNINNECDLFYVAKTDSIYGSLLVTRLKQNWPFTNTSSVYNELDFVPKTNIEKIAYDRYLQKSNWAAATNKLYQHYMQVNNLESAYQTAFLLSREYPILEEPIHLMVKPLLSLKRYYKVQQILEVSIQRIPSDKLNKEYFHILLINEEIAKSIDFLKKSYMHNDKNMLLDNLRALLSAKKSYQANTDSNEHARQLAAKYATFGLVENVSKYEAIADSLSKK